MLEASYTEGTPFPLGTPTPAATFGRQVDWFSDEVVANSHFVRDIRLRSGQKSPGEPGPQSRIVDLATRVPDRLEIIASDLCDSDRAYGEHSWEALMGDRFRLVREIPRSSSQRSEATISGRRSGTRSQVDDPLLGGPGPTRPIFGRTNESW